MADPHVDATIARFDELVARFDGRTPVSAARRREVKRDAAAIGKLVANMTMALAALIAAAVAYALIVRPIGLTGLFGLILACIVTVAVFAFWPRAPKRIAYNDQLPIKTVVQQLDSYLIRQRPLLPSPATQRLDAISAQLPLLEARLEQADLLDPLAQDARRLMGKHLPELIERYEHVPAAFRQQRDGEGMTVDERLISSLDAAQEALSDIGAKLTKDDIAAFETQGRFIESRYKDDDAFDDK